MVVDFLLHVVTRRAVGVLLAGDNPIPRVPDADAHIVLALGHLGGGGGGGVCLGIIPTTLGTTPGTLGITPTTLGTTPTTLGTTPT